MRGYLTSVVAVCMIGVIARQMVQKESVRKILHFVSGLLILLVVITPLLSLREKELLTILEEAGEQLQVDTEDMEEDARRALEQHIKTTAEEYIERKAKELGGLVQARVTLTQEEYPVPKSARIIGSLTPKQQLALSAYMSGEMGIEMERQEWELYG